ncbi:MAG: bifunctional phosphoribosyl-AMP cyclohydrolase/phosphoribosyl-ATP pyrophosphatase, partial [Deltaproteobacteria bacterium]|nr:bifunctional phosphoribosyl-AMP cyclohydrolase/phosphoribosyl-ATP pyrophosphatase [Deltaproteobacteria bacterium]
METIDFAKGGGIVPVVVQDHETLDVLMLAYMNEQAFNLTRETGKAHYYSRSRDKLWLKGEESGHFQVVHDIL